MYCQVYKQYLKNSESFSNFDSEIFKTEPDKLPMLYADSKFYDINRLYVVSDGKIEKEYTGKKYLTDEHGNRNIFREFGCGIIKEKDDSISIDTEIAMENSRYAYINNSFENKYIYEHSQSESYGGRGISMVFAKGEQKLRHGRETVDFKDTATLNYQIMIENAGIYYIWLLVKFDDDASDSCYIAVDDKVQEITEQYSKGNMFTYSMKQRWNWQCLSKIDLCKGKHTFSIGGRRLGLRIDRIYLTRTLELPPEDGDWICSEREVSSTENSAV